VHLNPDKNSLHGQKMQSKPTNGRFGPIIGKLEGELLSGSSQKFVEKPFCRSRYSLKLSYIPIY